MNPEPAIDRELLERLDACRPQERSAPCPELAGLEEALARDPRLADLAERLARWDEQATAAVHDVPVPAGLQQRLLDALERAAPAAAAASTSRSAQGNRRRWLAVAAVAAGVCGVAVTIWALRPAPARLAELVAAAAAWDQELPDDWRTIGTAPRTFPVPPSVTAQASRWQPAPANVAAAGAIYELVAPHGARAVLLVARLAASDLPARPPATPQSTTGGYAVGAWQADGLVYVLAVQGDGRGYRSCLDLPAVSPIAARPRPIGRPAA